MQVTVYTIAYRDDPMGHVRVEGFDKQIEASRRYSEIRSGIGDEYFGVSEPSCVSAQSPTGCAGEYWNNGCFVVLNII